MPAGEVFELARCSSARFTSGAAAGSEEIDRFASVASAELDALARRAETLTAERAEVDRSDLPRISPVREAAESVHDPLVAPQLDRLARAVSVIRQAIDRLTAKVAEA